MRLLWILTGFVLLASGALLAQTPSSGSQVPKNIPVFDLTALDRKIDPCTDFYQFACGGWKAHNPIPADQATWGRFNELYERNQAILHQILDKYSANDPKRSSVEQKIGDFYSSCMDENAINSKGLQPVQAELQRISALKSKSELADEVARLHQMGVNSLFDFGSAQDFKDANQVIAQADQAGLGLPDRDYYLKQDPKSVETRQKYVDHVQKMLQMAGESPQE